jgi:hypothetical protein
MKLTYFKVMIRCDVRRSVSCNTLWSWTFVNVSYYIPIHSLIGHILLPVYNIIWIIKINNTTLSNNAPERVDYTFFIYLFFRGNFFHRTVKIILIEGYIIIIHPKWNIASETESRPPIISTHVCLTTSGTKFINFCIFPCKNVDSMAR